MKIQRGYGPPLPTPMLVTIPTRVTDNSQTIINIIFTNDANALLPGVLQTDVSDHFAVFVFSFKHPKPKNAEATYLKRNKSNSIQNYFVKT